GQVVSEASSRREISPSDAPKRLYGAALAQRPSHNYPIPKPQRLHVKFGMTRESPQQHHCDRPLAQPSLFIFFAGNDLDVTKNGWATCIIEPESNFVPDRLNAIPVLGVNIQALSHRQAPRELEMRQIHKARPRTAPFEAEVLADRAAN